MTNATLLNVDDYHPVRYARTLILRQAGFEVKEAACGDEALRVATSVHPEVILLDVNLPDMTGFEVCRRLKTDPVTASIAVLHVSATHTAARDAATGLDGGADAYLVEPIDPAVLVASVRALLRLRRAEHSVRELLVREREARAEVERANRAKDEFLTMLGHELRNPLAPIASALGIIDRVASDNPTVAAATRVAERQVRHLTRLLDDLLDLPRSLTSMNLRREPVDVGRLLEDVMERHGSMIEANRLSVSLGLPNEPLTVEGDPTRLEQIVGNLVQNAAKFTPSGGALWITARRDGGQAVICVKDSGIGISEDLLPRVFDLFTQGDSSVTGSRGGLGIGLALVRRLVDLHGGTVRAQSDGPGHGSEFSVRLPLMVLPPGAPEPLHRHAPVTSPRRVLVVEDNADAREMLRVALELTGHQVTVAEHGAEGVAKALAERPDVMVVDLGLPGVDGYEVARRVRDRLGRSVRLIALTGYGQPQHAVRVRDAGFDAHLVKPVDFDTLARLLAA